MLFVLFSIFFIGLLYSHFSLAHMVWAEGRGRNSAELDMDYVRVENYFGRSFRNKVQQWLKLPYEGSITGAMRVIDRGVEKVIVAAKGMFPEGRRERLAMILEDDFYCGPGCHFESELMVSRDVLVGRGTQLQALACDGAAKLETGVTVRRWLDVVGPLEMQADCKVMSKVCSGHSIYFGPGSEALSLFAPEIETEGRLETSTRSLPEPREVVLIPHAANVTEPVHGYDPKLLYSMGGGAYLYNGSLKLSAPLHVRAPLVVKGSVETMEGSMIEADMKVKGCVKIGELSMIKRNLISDGAMEIGSGSFFQGVLHAGGDIVLKHGVRGLGLNPVVAYASQMLLVESDVVVRGKLAAGGKVKSISSPVAWLRHPSGNN